MCSVPIRRFVDEEESAALVADRSRSGPAIPLTSTSVILKIRVDYHAPRVVFWLEVLSVAGVPVANIARPSSMGE